MIKQEYDLPFQAIIISVSKKNFTYKREGERDKWLIYYNEVLPEKLQVKEGETYTGRNVITTDNGSFKTWKVEFKK